MTLLQCPALSAIVSAVDIIFLELHFFLVDGDVAEHREYSLLSGLLYKLCTALGAAYHDAPLASGNTDLLPAFGAAVNVIDLALGGVIAEILEKSEKAVSLLPVPLILLIALLDIPGEHAEINIEKYKEGQSTAEPQMGKPGKDQKEDSYP